MVSQVHNIRQDAVTKHDIFLSQCIALFYCCGLPLLSDPHLSGAVQDTPVWLQSPLARFGFFYFLRSWKDNKLIGVRRYGPHNILSEGIVWCQQAETELQSRYLICRLIIEVSFLLGKLKYVWWRERVHQPLKHLDSFSFYLLGRLNNLGILGMYVSTVRYFVCWMARFN